MDNNTLHPVDIGHLEDKAKVIKNYFEGFHNVDRSQEYREYCLSQAEIVSQTLVNDFAYIFDTKTFSDGKRGMGLDDIREGLKDK